MYSKVREQRRNPKQFIIKETAYYHQEMPESSNQQSFLLRSEQLSEEGEKQLQLINGMHTMIDAMTKRYAQKHKKIIKELISLDREGRHAVINIRDLILENKDKQNELLTVREKYVEPEQKKFELDQNLHYIKESQVGMGFKKRKQGLPSTQELYSPIVLRNVDTKEPFISLGSSSCRQSKMIENESSDESIQRVPLTQRAVDNPRVHRLQQYRGRAASESAPKKEKKKRCSNEKSNEKENFGDRRGKQRIYEDILSLYSTAKLLAMERK